MNANEVAVKADFVPGCQISACQPSKAADGHAALSYQRGLEKFLTGDLDQAYLLFKESIENDPFFLIHMGLDMI